MTDAITLAEVYKEIRKVEARMVTEEELAAGLETVMVLSNRDTMRQIRASKADISCGRTKEICSMRDAFDVWNCDRFL